MHSEDLFQAHNFMRLLLEEWHNCCQTFCSQPTRVLGDPRRWHVPHPPPSPRLEHRLRRGARRHDASRPQWSTAALLVIVADGARRRGACCPP